MKKEGFDINIVSDKIYFMSENKEYVPLDSKTYDDIMRQKIKM